MKLAHQHGLHSIAFPAISCGVYAYPLGPAAEIAITTVAIALSQATSVQTVIFVLFSEPVFAAFERAYGQLRVE